MPISGLREHPVQRSSLQPSEYTNTDGHGNAVRQGKTEEISFLSDHFGGSRRHADGLGRNHLAGNTAAGIRRYGQICGHADHFSCGALHTAEQCIGRSIGTGEKHSQPA